jgi:hypothetical protein
MAVLTTEQALARIARKIEVGLGVATRQVRTAAVKKINRSQPIRRSRSGRTIGLDPSLEGEPPKRLTGALIQSVSTRVQRRGTTAVVGIVAAGTKYARRLELGFVGTDSRGRHYSQGPRPWLRPSLEELRPRLPEIIARAGRQENVVAQYFARDPGGD